MKSMFPYDREGPPKDGWDVLWRKMPQELRYLVIGSVIIAVVIGSLLLYSAQVSECERVHPAWYCWTVLGD